MSNALPPEVEVQCLQKCRVPTIHSLQATLGGQAYYGCNNGCGAALRAISDPHLKTPGARANEQQLLEGQRTLWARQSRRDIVLPPPVRTSEDIEEKPKPKPVAPRRPIMAKNALQEAIDQAIAEALVPLKREITQAVDDVKDLLKKAVKEGDVERLVERLVESQLEKSAPEMMERSLLQMLARGKSPSDAAGGGRKRRAEAAAAPGGDSESCKHKNFMRKCASCQARNAAKEGE